MITKTVDEIIRELVETQTISDLVFQTFLMENPNLSQREIQAEHADVIRRCALFNNVKALSYTSSS